MNETAVSIVVVGAGPAGIAAAAHAREAGRDVLLVDQAPRAGGQIWRHQDRAGLPREARGWLERLDRSGVRTLMDAAVVDAESPFRLRLDASGRPLEVRVEDALIIATGASERFVPFPGWTLPGVVGIGGAQALVKSGMEVDGMDVVLAGSGPLLLPVAATLSRAGARVGLVAEQAPVRSLLRFGAGLWRSPSRWLEAVRYRAAFFGARYRAGSWVVRAEGADRVAEVTITDGRRARTLPCQLLCTGFGLIPASELARLLGCATEGRRVVVDEVQATSVAGVYCAGEASGIGGVRAALVEGRIAGLAAAGNRDGARRLHRTRLAHDRFAARLARAFRLRDELRSLAEEATLVCRCEDVRLRSVQELGSTRESKLHTRAGMGPCQGRVCHPALEHLFGWEVDSVRPPLVPTPVAILAGWADGEEHSRARSIT